MATVAADYHGRQMSVGRVFSRAFATIGHNPLVVIGLAVVVAALPMLLLNYLAAQIMGGFVRDFIGWWIVNSQIGLLVRALAQGMMTRAVVAERLGRRSSLGECLANGFQVFLPLVGLSLLISFAVGIGIILLVVPGIMLMLMWFVAMPVLAEEHEGVLAALSRSADLTEGARWKLFGIFLILSVVGGLFGAVFGFMSVLAHATIYSPAIGTGLTLASAAATILLYTITYTLWGTILPSLYVELRDWKEGGSVEALERIFV